MGFIEDTPDFPTKVELEPLPGGADEDNYFLPADYDQIVQALLDLRTEAIAVRARLDALEALVGDTSGLFRGPPFTQTFSGANITAFAGYASVDIAEINVTALTDLRGIVPAEDGRLVFLYNSPTSTNSIQVQSNDTVSPPSAAHAIRTPNAATFIIGPGAGCLMRYSTSLPGGARWHIIART